jgi:Ribbon-helix-helix protein, copG family
MVTDVRPIVAHPTAELRKRLESYSKDSGVSVSEIVRRALDEYLKSKEKPPRR